MEFKERPYHKGTDKGLRGKALWVTEQSKLPTGEYLIKVWLDIDELSAHRIHARINDLVMAATSEFKKEKEDNSPLDGLRK